MNLRRIKDTEYDLKRERIRKQFLESGVTISLSVKEASVNSSQKLQDIVDDKVQIAYNKFIKSYRN